MKPLILGSTVVDVILRLPRLPRSQESCNIYHQDLRLGGCAFNASEALRRFGADGGARRCANVWLGGRSPSYGPRPCPARRSAGHGESTNRCKNRA